jgi:hypothetical protein
MEEQNLSENIQEVADLENDVETTSEENQDVANPESQNKNTADTAEEKKTESRDYERDAAFANMRREMEEKRRELEEIKAQKERLAKAFGLFGFNGTTDDIEDQAKAHYYGRNVEEIRQERIAQAQKEAEQNEIRDQLKYYKEKELKERMDRDLSEIQKLNPNVRSFDDLPKDYFELVAKGIEGTRAYKLLHAEGLFENANQVAEQKAIAKIQANSKASVGSAGSGEVKEKVTYANMSDAEFENLIQKVKRGEYTP